MNILLRAVYVATDLVTSQSFQPIRCAFMLCEFGRIRAVYVATRIQVATCRLRGHQNTSGYVPSTWPPEYKWLRAVYVATRIQVATCRLRGHQNTSGYVPSTWPPEYKRLRAVYVATRSGLNRCSSIIKQVIMIFFDYFTVF